VENYGLCPAHLNRLKNTKEPGLQATITKDKNSKKPMSTLRIDEVYHVFSILAGVNPGGSGRRGGAILIVIECNAFRPAAEH